MANELRITQLAVGGLVEDNPLTSGATTLTSAGLAAVSGGVGSTQYLAIVVDPDGIDGAPEIVWVTALTAGAGSATVVRAQEGTTARQHVAGTPWVHAATPYDIGNVPWTAYTPSWTCSSGGNPAIGNGTIKGAYQIVGKQLFIRVHIVMGSTTTFGGGAYQVSMPTNVVGRTDTSARQLLTAWGYDNSAGGHYPGICRVDSGAGTLMTAFANAGSINLWDATHPFAWATSDELHAQGVIEIA